MSLIHINEAHSALLAKEGLGWHLSHVQHEKEWKGIQDVSPKKILGGKEHGIPASEQQSHIQQLVG